MEVETEVETNIIEIEECIFDFDAFMKFVSDGNIEEVTKLLAEGIDVNYQDENLRTPLHFAASNGNFAMVQLLFENGAIWNALDDEEVTAGEYALRKGHAQVYEELVSAGCRCELLMDCLADHENTGDYDRLSDEYLSTSLKYVDDKLYDAEGNGVMMGWETPLMKAHADYICETKTLEDGTEGVGHILNVGFGLGIIDTLIQEKNPRTHTIIEAHPDVYAHMKKLGWDKKPKVTILFGKWQDVVGDLKLYDGIFFDTYGEFYKQLKNFHDLLGPHLAADGRYSYFNGLAATNQFFHDVYCALVPLELLEIGVQTEFKKIDMVLDDEEWKTIKRKYWTLTEYRMPMCTWQQL